MILRMKLVGNINYINKMGVKMEKLIKIGEVNAEGSAELKLLREVLEKAGFIVAEYPEGRFEDYLIILEKKQMEN